MAVQSIRIEVSKTTSNTRTLRLAGGFFYEILSIHKAVKASHR